MCFRCKFPSLYNHLSNHQTVVVLDDDLSYLHHAMHHGHETSHRSHWHYPVNISTVSKSYAFLP